MIENILKEINNSLEQKEYIVALYSILSIISACANIEYKDAKFNGNDRLKYENWCENYIIPYFKKNNINCFSKPDIYQLRCSLIHSSSNKLKDKKNQCRINKIILCKESSSNYNFISSNGYNEIQINIKYFVQDLIYVVNLWINDRKNKKSEYNLDLNIFDKKWSSEQVDGTQGFLNCD